MVHRVFRIRWLRFTIAVHELHYPLYNYMSSLIYAYCPFVFYTFSLSTRVYSPRTLALPKVLTNTNES